ncbi:MAG: hypothetical protein AAF530_22100 [Pseudomonadota bacterium]
MIKSVTAGVAALFLMAAGLTACDEAQQQTQVPDQTESDASTTTEQDTAQ